MSSYQSTSGIKLAIAEDHTIVREGMKALLEKQGDFVVVVEAADGVELISKLRESAILPDICLVDINMPKMNGYDTILNIRQQWSDLKTVAVSMYMSEFSIIRLMRNGAAGYMPKNCSINDLARALNEVHKFGFFFWGGVMSKLYDKLADKTLQSRTAVISPIEQEYLNLCCQDISHAEIANRMNKSARTVEDYRNSLFHKFQVNNRLALVLLVLKAGLVTIEP